jgi:cephalosporin hydroxylase
MNLREIIAHYDINGHEKDGGTDKDTFHSYIEMYERFLAPLTSKSVTVAEIGIQYGGSMLLWQDYLPFAKFIYLDNVDAIHPKVREHLDVKRAKLLFEDAYTEEAVAKVKKLARKGIDFIIDDGPHTLESQCQFLSLYLPLLAQGGVALIEDVQSPDWITSLQQQVPAGFSFEIIDLRGVKGRYDDLVFAVTKQDS